MIIYTVDNLKAYEIWSDLPNADWTGEADFVVDETAKKNLKLMTKIKKFAPFFDYVTDSKGNLVDVIKTADKPEPEAPKPDPVTELQTENKALKAQVAALTESQQFLEECLVEMAEIVYA